jgi:hypothetical protein
MAKTASPKKPLVLELDCGPEVAELIREVLKALAPARRKPNGHDVAS